MTQQTRFDLSCAHEQCGCIETLLSSSPLSQRDALQMVHPAGSPVPRSTDREERVQSQLPVASGRLFQQSDVTRVPFLFHVSVHFPSFTPIIVTTKKVLVPPNQHNFYNFNLTWVRSCQMSNKTTYTSNEKGSPDIRCKSDAWKLYLTPNCLVCFGTRTACSNL